LIKQRAENDFSSNLQVEEARMRNRSNLQSINKPIEQPSALGLVTDVVTGVAGAQIGAANYSKAVGQAPSYSNMFGLGNMLGIQPNAPRAQIVQESPFLATSYSPPSSLPSWNQGVPASGSLLPPI